MNLKFNDKCADDLMFNQFWSAYPHRVSKKAAQKAFEKAIKETTLEQILAGVENYKANKPSGQQWCHASSWLNGERFNDEYAPPEQPKATGNTKAQILRDDIKRIDARIQWLLGQRPLNPKLAAELTNAKANREMVFTELRKLI